MSLSRFIQMRLTLGYDPLSRNHQWLWTTTFASHTSGGKRWSLWSLPCWPWLHAGTRAFWTFVRQAYGLLFLSLHSNRSEDSKPWRDQQVAVFLPGNCVSFDVFQVWFKLEGCVSWWHSNLLRSQDRCITEAVRKVTLGATLLLHTGLVCWWGTQSSVGSVDHLKRFCKMLVDWCHPCCFCQHFEVQLVTTRADKLSMQPIRIFCSDGTDLAVTG